MKSLVVYSVLRLLVFLVPLLLMLGLFPIFREHWWLAVVFATLIGWSLSMVLLGGRLSNASRALHALREGRVNRVAAEDAAVEDAAADDGE